MFYQDRPVISLELPFTPTPRRAQAVSRSVDIMELTTPLKETPVLVCGSHHRTPATPPSIQRTPIRCLFGSPQGSHVSCHSVSSTPPRVRASAQLSGLSSPSGSTVSWAPTTPTLSPPPDVMWRDIGLQPMSTLEPRHRRVLFHTPSTDVISPRYHSDIGSHMDSGGSQPQSPMSEDSQSNGLSRYESCVANTALKNDRSTRMHLQLISLRQVKSKKAKHTHTPTSLPLAGGRHSKLADLVPASRKLEVQATKSVPLSSVQCHVG